MGYAFVGVNLGRQRGRIGKFQGDMTFPLGFQGSDIDDDPAARVGALTETNHQDVAGDAQIFDGAGQREGVWGDHADIGLEIHEAVGVEVLGIDNRRIDIGEDLEFVGTEDVVAVAGGTEGNEALT